jgi:hypothetical protein
MKLLNNIILYIAAVVLTVLLFIPGIIHAIYAAIRWGSFYMRINYYFLNSAVSIDIMCNSLFSPLLNDWFLRKNGYHFGKKGETISSALGKNQCVNGLTYMGKGLAGILNLLQKDHCWISIDEEDYHIYYKKPEAISKRFTFVAIACIIIVLYTSYQLLKYLT